MRDIIFSIITVCFNSENTIENTIKSVLNQNSTSYEYIIIDGGSKDDTIKIANKHREELGERLKIISEPDEGPYDAMNKGMKIARGKLLCFLNSDDILEENILNEVLEFYKKNDFYDIYYGDVLYEENDARDNIIRTHIKAKENIEKIKKGMIFCHQSSFVKKEIIIELNGFNNKYKIAADWEFFLRCYKNNAKFIYIDKILSIFKAGGLSSSNHSAENHKIRKKYKLYKFIDLHYITEVIKVRVSKILKKYLNSFYIKIKKIKYRGI